MPSFSLSKFKVELKLSVNRLRLLQAKKSSLNAKARREIATLLEAGKERSAYIRVEGIIREDFNIEALEMVELYCELLTARAGLIDQSRTVDPDIGDAVWAIIYASTRAEVRELILLRDMLTSKFGAEVVKSAIDNAENQVDPKLVRKLCPKAPSQELVVMYLKEIASVYRVGWRPAGEKNDGHDGDGTPGGGIKEPAKSAAELAAPPGLFKAEDVEEEVEIEAGADVETEVSDQSSPEKRLAEQDDSAKGDSEANDAALPSVSPPSPPKAASDETPAAKAAPRKVPTAVPPPPAKSPSPAFAKPKPAKQKASDGLPTFEELQRRIEALKQH
ncbi:Vacuolar protein sorting-associated protein ist1 [Coemansia sp. RSA 1286]|nr:Vacuolar protein sorting-associated protein ist1 [Coemansia sp. RSA 1286]